MADAEGGRRLEVRVQSDHLERLEKSKPATALAELIWNAFDADATKVSVEFTRNSVDGVEAILVRDDGVGIGGEGSRSGEPGDLFRNLGGSWKKTHRRTSSDRAVHGQVGEGRFRAFALGEKIVWDTRVLQGGRPIAFQISRTRGTKSFDVTKAVPTDQQLGTTVTILNVDDTPAPDSDRVFEALCREFALYLLQYPKIQLVVDGRRIDPAVLITKREQLPDVEAEVDGKRLRASLTVIEWNVAMERAIYFCDPDGFALADVPPGIQARGFSFTAYTRSGTFRELREKNLLDTELATEREVLLEGVKSSLRDYFRTRAAEQAAGAVERWRQEEVYPYEGKPASEAETVERQVFDIVAINLATHLPDFEKTDAKQKRLTFRLVKHAVEENPASLQLILGEVVGLPKEKQDELAELLRQTSLSAIINAAHVVAGRLNFLKGLEELIFPPENKSRLKERKQLHRLLASNTWIFGEEYNLTVDDESLTSALDRHLELLGRPKPGNGEAVVRTDGTEGILDVMLSRMVPQPNPLEREHLVVELKRPSQAVDSKVVHQTQSYAFAVAGDERFRDTRTRWKFICVSNEMRDDARRMATQRHKPPGLVHDDDAQPLTVWAFTWGDLIQRAQARLEFFRKALEFSATRSSSRDHLKKVYARYLPEEAAEASEDGR